MADRWSSGKRRALMRRVRTAGTAPEVALRKAMWDAGLRGWRLNVRGLPGRPDVAWKGRKVAVFVDGAFWHGHPDHYWGQSGEFWDKKIAANRARDLRVTKKLEEEAWIVLRFWDFEVLEDPGSCAERVGQALASRPTRTRT